MDGAETHRTRFGGGVDDTAGKIVGPELPAGLADGVDLGMGSRVPPEDGVAGDGHDPPVLDDAGAERAALETPEIFPRLAEREFHALPIGNLLHDGLPVFLLFFHQGRAPSILYVEESTRIWFNE
jgi:hypothetical protein